MSGARGRHFYSITLFRYFDLLAVELDLLTDDDFTTLTQFNYAVHGH